MSIKKTCIVCPVHKQEVVASCNLSSCIYYTQYPNVSNCMLVYMATQGLESLGVSDISLLTKMAPSKIIEITREAMRFLRFGLMDSGVNPDLEASFSTLINQNVCICCERPIVDPYFKKHFISDNDFVLYCSSACLDRKAPLLVTLERQCKTDIGTILQWAIRKYSTLGSLSQALKMNRTVLGKYLKYYLNIDADILYSTTQRVRTRSASVTRRTGKRPVWLESFFNALRSAFSSLPKQYKSSREISRINNEVCEVIEKS